MLRPPASLDLRKHPRALLRLPVRLRWSGPLGMRLEVTHTIDTSKEGLLVRRAEPCELFTRVWAAFPYDPQGAAQPETPATVVRVERDPRGSFRVALRLELAAHRASRKPVKERRKEPRLYFALPVFVRPFGTPWPEESMTQDVSRSGVRFETAHVYKPGENVLAKISWAAWAGQREIPGRVMRIQTAGNGNGSPLSDPYVPTGDSQTSVAVRWTTPPKS